MASQIILGVMVLLLLFLAVRKIIVMRAVTQYSPGEAEGRMKEGAAVFLDVRTADERKQGSIKGSLHIPLHELRNRLDELDRYKQREVVCYCRSGSRSLSAALLLHRNGFSAASLRGGIAEWKFSHR